MSHDDPWLITETDKAWSPCVLACYSGRLSDVRVFQSRSGRLFAYFDIVNSGGRTPFIAWPAVMGEINVAYLTDGAPGTVLAAPGRDADPRSALHLAPSLGADLNPPPGRAGLEEVRS